VLVDGGSFTPNDRIYMGIEACHATYGITELLYASSGNKGDRLAAEWCRRKGIKITKPPRIPWANMNKYHPRTAAPMRNAAMIAMKPDLLLAFKHGTGLMDMMRRAKAAGIPITKVDFS
jgi:hypothetical protein